jgi:hypothetical protein
MDLSVDVGAATGIMVMVGIMVMAEMVTGIMATTGITEGPVKTVRTSLKKLSSQGSFQEVILKDFFMHLTKKNVFKYICNLENKIF